MLKLRRIRQIAEISVKKAPTLAEKRSMAAPVFYFRGLNTSGDDLLHLGPYKPDTMFGVLQEEYLKKGVPFIPVTGMGTAPLPIVISRAKQFILEHPEWEKHKKVHFYGHSTGGVVARALLHEPEFQGRVISHLSLAVPHRGCKGADNAILTPEARPIFTKFMSAAGWEESRLQLYHDLSTAGLEEFNQQYRDIENVDYASIPCAVTPDDICWPLYPLYFMTHRDPYGQWCHLPSDGLIHLESQKWGEILGECTLDHISQLGHFYFFSSARKQKHRSQFAKMIDPSVAFWDRYS